MAILVTPEAFRFDFSELRSRSPDLRVLDRREGVPVGAVELPHPARPGWLPPLLPVFGTGRELRVEVAAAAAPSWAARVLSMTAAVLAMASESSAVSVVAWPTGFAAGPPGFREVPSRPAATVIAAEADQESITCATRLLSTLESPGMYIALHGDLPNIDQGLGIDDAFKQRAHLVRFPLFSRRELAAIAGAPPLILPRGSFSSACLELASQITAGHRACEP